MKLLRAWLGALPGYLWSGWGAIASLLLGMALWEALAAEGVLLVGSGSLTHNLRDVLGSMLVSLFCPG